MKDLLTYILKEIKDQRLSKEVAVDLIRQIRPGPSAAHHQSVIHPMIHRNTSDLQELRFSSTFVGDEFYLAHHTAGGQKILPGVAHLEMAREAISQAIGKESRCTVQLNTVNWISPLIVNEKPLVVHTILYPKENGELSFKISSGHNSSEIIYSEGNAILIESFEEITHDLVALKAECTNTILESDQCYKVFNELGMDYGPSFKGITRVYAGKRKVLAKLALPDMITSTLDEFFLHPSLLDSAIQAMIGLQTENGGIGSQLNAKIPFSLDAIEIYRPCVANMWALILEEDLESDKVQNISVDLCDDQGRVCARIMGFSFKVLSGEMKAPTELKTSSTFLFELQEEEQGILTQQETNYAQHVVVLCEPNADWREQIKTKLSAARVVVLAKEGQRIEKRYEEYAIDLFLEIRSILKGKLTAKILFQVVVNDQVSDRLLNGLWALIKTAGMENPNFIGQFIEVREFIADITGKLHESSRTPTDTRIIYQNNKRWIMNWRLLENLKEKMPWKDSGVYLLTGGVGALGLIFASEIATQARNVTLIITGRSPLTEEKANRLKALRELGASVVYKQVDVAQLPEVESCVKSIQTDFGGLDGIVHSAGVIHDQYIILKNEEEWPRVLAPKVSAVVNLDLATQTLPLDFFILFSSGAGVTGNPGQSDYATANAFMDNYSFYRNHLVACKQRHGRTLSINWPLWQDGGMQIDDANANLLEQKIGLQAISTPEGIRALYQCYGSGLSQVIVMKGEAQKLNAWITGQDPIAKVTRKTESVMAKGSSTEKNEEFEEKALNFFKNKIAAFIKLSPHALNTKLPLEKYGLESILMAQLIAHLEKLIGPVPKTLFFEYQSVQAVTEYFLDNHGERLQQLLRESDKSVKVPNGISTTPKVLRRAQVAETAKTHPKDSLKDIAVIGVSGKYPQAKNVEEFWQNLVAGKDCITEVPKERWDHDVYFRQEKGTPEKKYCKWGGFLNDVDMFDPLFFSMSPREASITDPQERLFLEVIWNLIESSGYTRESIRQNCAGKVGVYVGAMYQQYQLLPSDDLQGALTSLSTHSSIANRVSYFFDFNGPSVALDTACSSSIVALHSACESLIRGECKMAIAGGVNLTLHPKKYMGLTVVNLIASHPDSRSFGNGDGYLPAEGAGAVLLKPLSEAIKDGDTIMAVIKSTTINHNGNGNGFTAPNPSAQAQLMEENFRKSGIDPRTISYVEAAANGSFLGDPIELTGLNKAFKKFTQDEQFCGIGSVKSNIGHAEAASGISQLTKVILQLKHQQLVPSIKAYPLNPNIKFDNTPFFLQKELSFWKRPILTHQGKEQEIPRRAMVSAFGAGGTNGHVILEEYILDINNRPNAFEGPYVMVFSAKDNEQLKRVVRQILQFIDSNSDLDLYDLAFTLQMGKEAMPCRLAFVVKNRNELISGLQTFLEPENEIRGTLTVPLLTGNVEEEDPSGLIGILVGKSGKLLLDLALSENNLENLALYWTKGLEIPWEKLNEKEKAHRIVLPTYPFQNQRCWIDSKPDFQSNSKGASANSIGPTNTDSTNFKQDVYELIIDMLQIRREDFAPERSLQHYGVDSILFIQLVKQLQRQISPLIQLNNLQTCRTSYDILNAVQKLKNLQDEENQSAKHSLTYKLSQFPELVLLNNDSANNPVFWFHAGAGGVEIYQPLAKKSRRPFYGIMARGYMTDREPLQGIEAMAKYYIQIIQSVQPEGPYDFGGYSLGGLIAYEVTRQLQEVGQVVNSITMIDSFYGEEFKGEGFDEKDAILQIVNIALSASVALDPEKLSQVLIHREQVDKEAEPAEFMTQLITLARGRGLNKSEKQLRAFISQTVKVQQAYHSLDFTVVPLPDPTSVTCYYFRNKNGCFLGEMGPYFLVNRDETAFDHANYWNEWKNQFPDFHSMDIDVANHMVMLSDPISLETISDFCERLYSEHEFSMSFLKDFKKKTRNQHGMLKNVLSESV